MRQVKKIQTAAIGMLCLTALTTGACVTQSTYDTAAADLEAAKAELRSVSTETQELAQQVSDLQKIQIGIAREREVASSALRQARKAVKVERTASQLRLSKLTRTIQHLTTQQKSLQYAVKRSTEEQVRLQSAVDNHTSKLGEVDELSASSASLPAQPALVPNESVPKPTVTTTAAPVNQPAANPKPQSAGNQPPDPVEEDWLTFFKNWITSFWQSIFF